jgi:GNAT superfamily N-acetyltransferase
LPSTLRLAGVADVAVVADCVLRAYARYDKRLPIPPRPVLADYTTVVREHPTWLLEQDGRCVGVLVLAPEADHLLLENVAVDPSYQGRGFGGRLLDFAEAEARRQGFTEIRLYTNALMTENRAIYARRGYVEYAQTHVDGRDVVFMRKQLH